jgi:hypothetical protein
MAVALLVNGQKLERASSKDSPIPKVILREWQTKPIFLDGITETSENRVKVIEEIEVKMKGHNLAKEQLLFAETCYSKFDKRQSKNKNGRGFVLNSFGTYEIKGRVFGYRIPLAIVMTEKGHITERAGAMWIAHYIDEDGNGKFKLRCDKNLELKTLPEWVKSLAAK